MKFGKAMTAALLMAAAVGNIAGGAAAEESYLPAVKLKRILDTSKTSSGDPVQYPDVKDPEVQTLLVEIAPGGQTGWHTHPLPAYAYILSGAVEVEMAGGAKQVFKAGDSFAEMVNRVHNGRVIGEEPVRILMIVTGEKGTPISVKASPPR